jgi:hypothetical protein
MKTDINIPAVHDDDLKKILSNYGILNEFDAGQSKCFVCNNPVTWDNIYGIFLVENQPKLVCDSIECIDKINNTENG